MTRRTKERLIDQRDTLIDYRKQVNMDRASPEGRGAEVANVLDEQANALTAAIKALNEHIGLLT